MKWICFLAMVLTFGCKQPEKKTVIKTISHYDTVLAKRQIRGAQRQRQFLADSLRQDSVLSVILNYANNHTRNPYKAIQPESLKKAGISCSLSFGHLFSKDKKHLIVQDRINGYQFNWNIFVLDNTGFKRVISEVVDDLTYVDHFIKDINGDGDKDFLLHWYPESGCCRRNVFNAYLYKQKTGEFTPKYQFMNPTFSAAEKIIRGVDYGHPGQTGLYKYRWDGFKLDTIEFISPDSAGKKFYLTKTRKFGQSGKLLATVPKEYHKIESYDWFKGIY